MPPEECDSVCQRTRIRLYISYSVLLGALLLVAVIHFIVFLVRRKSKYEAKEYATRKHELITIAFPETLSVDGKESSNGSESNSPERNEADERSRSTRSGSPNDSDPGRESQEVGPTTLQKIDEETFSGIREAINRHTPSTSSAESSRHRSLTDALQEPVIVTVATVSALFQHEMNDKADRRSSGGSSVIDISDLVNSPGCSVKVDDKENAWKENHDHGESVGENLHRSQYPRLDVRVGGGSFTKRPFNNIRIGEAKLEDSLSSEAIFPAGSGTFSSNGNLH